MQALHVSVAIGALAAACLSACASTKPASVAGGGTSASAGHGGGTSSGGSGATTSSGGSGATGQGGNTNMKTYAVIGSGDWSGATGKVSVYGVDLASGKLTPVQAVDAGLLDSFVAIAPSARFLVAGDEAGKKLRAFSIDPATAKLTLVNEQTALGGPVYVKIDRTEKNVLAAYYNEGQSEVFRLGADGRIGASADSEQSGAQSHSIVLDPSEKWAFVSSKGEDKISQYAFDAASGALSANTPASVAVSGGPRHLAFHPTLPYAYGANENGNTVTSYAFDAAAGRLTVLETQNSLPDGFTGQSAAADVHVLPNGRFVYVTNRPTGSDGTVMGFSVNATTGKLTRLASTSSRGTPPRNFAIHPDGTFMLVANHDSMNVAAYAVNPTTGALSPLADNPLGLKPFWVGFLRLPG